MTIFEAIKFIRTQLDIPQDDMIENMPASTYSRIENGERHLKFNVLQDICKRLGLTLSELLQFAQTESIYQQFLILINECVERPNDQNLKKKLLKEFYPNKKIERLEIEELVHYCSIKCVFASIWEEIVPLSTHEINYLYTYLSKKKFHTLMDYQIAMNSIIFFSPEESKQLVKLMYPVKYPAHRTGKTKTYANHLLTNLITVNIYNLDYKTALSYITLAEETMDFSSDYYLRLNIQYHKNVVLRFLEKDTIYIEKAREVIKIMYAVGDPLTAKQYETELNNLTNRADHYLDLHNYPRTTLKE